MKKKATKSKNTKTIVIVCCIILALIIALCLYKMFTVRLDRITVTYNGEDIPVGGTLNKSDVTVHAIYSDGSDKTVTDFDLSDFDSSTAGNKTVTVTYTEGTQIQTATFTVTVYKPDTTPVTLVRIEVAYNGGDVAVNGEIDRSAIVVTAYFSDDTSRQVTDYVLQDCDLSQNGQVTVTVSYTYLETTQIATFTVTVTGKHLVSIQAEYVGPTLTVGAQLDVREIIVTATYSDGTTSQVAGFTISDFDSSTAGDKAVTISYTVGDITQTATITVAVRDKQLVSIQVEYVGATLTVGEQLDTNNIIVTATYSNGAVSQVFDFTISDFDSSTAGNKTVTISCTVGNITQTATFTVTVVDDEPVKAVADMSIHFIDLGSNSGDSIYIKAGDTDILIDAGAIESSAETITNYVNKYCEDGILEYVIVTHADKDHIAGFVGTTKIPGVLDVFECQTIIRFARTDKNTNILQNFYKKLDNQIKQGANCYTALECVDNSNDAQKVYEIADGITMEILDQRYYREKSGDENNYSVCVMFTQGDNHYLFTGDLEESGETSLVNSNPNLPQVELYKAGHHGSATSSNPVLLNKIKPLYVCTTCAAGDQYNFPTQAFINRIANYTDNVYVTGIKTSGYVMNGNVVFSCVDGEISIHGSKNDTKLKDSDWFKKYRTCPQAWAN